MIGEGRAVRKPQDTEMQDEHLTAGECDELVRALLEDAAILPSGPERKKLLELAEGYRILANMKRMVLRNINEDDLSSS
jgi:hypothetical protein